MDEAGAVDEEPGAWMRKRKRGSVRIGNSEEAEAWLGSDWQFRGSGSVDEPGAVDEEAEAWMRNREPWMRKQEHG